MNKRIKELAEQALNEYTATYHNEAKIPEAYLKKFAELIVLECAKAAYKYTDDSKNYEHYDDIGWDCLPGDLQSHIKEHFGVEE